MKTLVLGSIALVLPLTSHADPVPKQLEALEPLVGSFKGNGTLTAGKDVAKVDFTLACKRTSARFAVQCAFHVTGVPGLAAYEESDLFGYEPATDTYHWYAVTNAGETHDHVAKSFGDKVQWTYSGSQDGKPMKEVIDMTIGKDKSIAFRSETLVAGSSVAVLEGKVHK
jgi:hypothetical protein